MTEIEWPKGSGRIAVYTDDERAEIRALVAEGEAAGIEKSKIARELSTYHDMKVEFAAEWVPVPDDLDLGFDLPPESQLRLPAHLIRERQLDIVIAARRRGE